MPKVSVIVPVYQVEQYIKRCIESVLNQTLTDWELILVDDFGKDSSMDIVKQYSRKDIRIKYIESDKHVGPMMAREKGYRCSTGNYITFLDGDDTITNNALEILYDKAITTEADIVSARICRIFPNGKTEIFFNDNSKGFYTKKDIYFKLLQNEFTHNLCAKLFKGKLLRDNIYTNIEGLTYGEDGYLFYQVLYFSNNIVSVQDVVYNYFMNSSSTTNAPMTEEKLKSLAIFSKYQYDMFKKELGDIDTLFYKQLYINISNHAKRFPFRRIKQIYKDNGIEMNISFYNLLNYFSFLDIIKYSFKIRLFYYLRKMKSQIC